MPKAAPAPSNGTTASSRTYSTSAADSGCGSVNRITSKRSGSALRVSTTSIEAGNGPVGGRP